MVLVSDDVVFAQNPGRGFGDKNQGLGDGGCGDTTTNSDVLVFMLIDLSLFKIREEGLGT